MLVLLDTTTVSEIIRENPKLDARLATLPSSDKLIICTIVEGELRFGVERLPIGKKRQKLQLKLDEVLAKLRCELVPAVAAREYARIKNLCKVSGVSLDDNDLWIAATAVSLGARLVSCDRDFARVNNLDVEDWTL
jgi:tRNA(fMet)-specific endonuclease VapC